MKRYIFLLIVFLSINVKVNAQIDTEYNVIAQLNLNHYAILPIDSFLHVIPQSYDTMNIYGVLTKNKVLGLGIHYPSGMLIMIRPKKYLFMNPIDPNRVWDINLMKKEIASSILVLHPNFNSLSDQNQ